MNLHCDRTHTGHRRGGISGLLHLKIAGMGCGEIAAPRRREFDLTIARRAPALRELPSEVVVHAAAWSAASAPTGTTRRFFYENAIMGIQTIEPAAATAWRRPSSRHHLRLPKFTPVLSAKTSLWTAIRKRPTPPTASPKGLAGAVPGVREQYGMNAVFLLPVNLYGPRTISTWRRPT